MTKLKPAGGHILTAVLIAAILGALAALSYSVAVPVEKPFTEFYLLGSEGKAGDYPTQLRAGKPAAITLGIVNREGAEMVYRVAATVDGQPASLLLDDAEVAEVGPIALGHKEQWEQQISFASQKVGPDQKVEFLLLAEGRTAPYLSTYLWVDVT